MLPSCAIVYVTNLYYCAEPAQMKCEHILTKGALESSLRSHSALMRAISDVRQGANFCHCYFLKPDNDRWTLFKPKTRPHSTCLAYPPNDGDLISSQHSGSLEFTEHNVLRFVDNLSLQRDPGARILFQSLNESVTALVTQNFGRVTL